MFVQALQTFPGWHFEVRQQAARAACVLSQNQVDLSENLSRTW
jgi:hypothetical protein